jgi:aminoglycoside phosphotransferase (APT) family kinase protein
MHEDEIEVSEETVRRLLASQFLGWADLPLSRVAESGTDHALFRLGDDLVVRLPRIAWADGQAALEAEWLPWLAPRLPLTLSIPVALGEPDDGYPFAWSVNPWLPGQPLDPASVDPVRLSVELAEFVRALQSCDATGARLFGSRGQPWTSRNAIGGPASAWPRRPTSSTPGRRWQSGSRRNRRLPTPARRPGSTAT